MKKITLLLVAFLAISGMAFGQKVLKTLWEKQTFEVTPFGAYGDASSFMRMSPNGNIFTSTRPGGIAYFD